MVRAYPMNRLPMCCREAKADTLMQGQGIGLAVVADIVDSYGGDVSVTTSVLVEPVSC